MNETKTARRASGRCLCGAVAYAIDGPLRDVINCHCGQCLRTHGNFASYTNVARKDLSLTESRGLNWYESSPKARRGFCAKCGASLFWERKDSGTISVSAGTLDPPTNLTTAGHIFVADKGDYYELADGLKSYPASMSKA